MTISRTIAKLVSRGGPHTTLAEANALVADIRTQARRAPRIVGVVTGLEESAERVADIPVKVVDRVSWAAGATASLLSMVDGGKPRLRSQLTVVLSAMSSKVLGQYDPYSSEESTLYIVAPNLAQLRETYDLDRRDLALWVSVHEFTHAIQFAQAPWLVDYMVNAVKAVLANDNDATFKRVITVMSLLEGHASWTMDNVPLRMIPSRRRLADSLQARRHAGKRLTKQLTQIFGIDQKRTQYSQGKHFTAVVMEQAGIETFNKVWRGPENLPTVQELVEPERWIERMSEGER